MPKCLEMLLTGTTGNPFYADPPQREHSGMVVDVKESELIIFLPKNEEDSVAELKKFAEIVPPHSIRYLKTGRRN